MSLKPNIRQMLEIGKDLGLTTLDEAHSNYMRHYDCFFLISDFQEQNNKFVIDIITLGWLDETKYLKDLTIEECLEQLTK